MKTVVEKAITCLSEQSKKIFTGNYADTEKIYDFDNKEFVGEEVSELVENFGLMAVKLEAREMFLNQKILELEEKQIQLNIMAQLRVDSTYIFVSLIAVISIFSFILVLIQSLDQSIDKETLSFLTSRATEIVFVSLFVVYAMKRKISVKEFGVNLNNATRAISEALGATLIVIFLISAIKYFMIRYGFINQQPIVSFAYFNWTFLTYALVAPLQEFVARGVGQSSIQRVLTGKFAWLEAIFVTALIFGMMHLTYSIEMAILSFLGSIVWGYLFHRNKTIVGISISHFLIGLWLGMCGILN